ncbi:MAG: acyl carrier protein [Puniceicoccales bacterium]
MNSEEVLRTVIEVIEEITEDWDLEEPVEKGTRLSADLGFSSVDVVQLFASISARFQQKFRYDKLIVDEQEQYKDELTVGEIAEYVEASMI